MSSGLRLTTRALHWDRGRPARLRAPQGAKISLGCSTPKCCSRCALTAGGTPAVPVKSLSGQAKVTTKGWPPATSAATCEDLARVLNSKVPFALRAHGGRDAHGPSEELEWSSAGYD
jgi:hypothetical protein